MGRPSEYTPEMAERICAELAECGSLRAVCRQEWAPERSTVARWVEQDIDGFAAKYARAKDLGIDNFVEETIEIADDASNDWMEKLDREGQSAGWLVNHDHVSRSKVRIETRRWLAERMAPKRYGPKQDITSGGEPIKGNAVAVVERMSIEQWKKAHGLGDVETPAG